MDETPAQVQRSHLNCYMCKQALNIILPLAVKLYLNLNTEISASLIFFLNLFIFNLNILVNQWMSAF